MNYEIVESFAQMVREKGIDRDILAGIVEDVFGMMMRKKYGPEAKFDVVVNMEKGDIEIYLEKEVVETVTDPNTQIDIETARSKTDENLQPGDEFVEIVDLSSFGRRLVVSGKQNLNQRIKEIEKELIYNEYTGSLGEIVVGEIYQIRKNEILVNHNRNELILPKSEQIFKERYKKGETIRAIIKEVRKNSGNPVVIISRADPKFLEKLFEIEIPEIYDGVIEIKTLAREPGERAKVAVLSHDDRIDAVGACVGMKGVRIHSIVRELNNENIDVINYSDDPVVFVTRALAPAKVKQIEIVDKTANVLVPNDQMSLLIGRNGQNIRLASRLTGYTINPIKEKPEVEYDIDLTEFQEEIGEELYEKLVSSGYSTAQEVIKAGVRNLVEGVGIEEPKVRQLVSLLEIGLEEAEIAEEEEEDENDDENEEEKEEEEEEEEESEGGEKEDEEEDEEEEEAGKAEEIEEGEEKDETKESKEKKKKVGKPKVEEGTEEN
jgi:N utilization substance protein A